MVRLPFFHGLCFATDVWLQGKNNASFSRQPENEDKGRIVGLKQAPPDQTVHLVMEMNASKRRAQIFFFFFFFFLCDCCCFVFTRSSTCCDLLGVRASTQIRPVFAFQNQFFFFFFFFLLFGAV
jgi:hypothetical protein